MWLSGCLRRDRGSGPRTGHGERVRAGGQHQPRQACLFPVQNPQQREGPSDLRQPGPPLPVSQAERLQALLPQLSPALQGLTPETLMPLKVKCNPILPLQKGPVHPQALPRPCRSGHTEAFATLSSVTSTFPPSLL